MEQHIFLNFELFAEGTTEKVNYKKRLFPE